MLKYRPCLFIWALGWIFGYLFRVFFIFYVLHLFIDIWAFFSFVLCPKINLARMGYTAPRHLSFALWADVVSGGHSDVWSLNFELRWCVGTKSYIHSYQIRTFYAQRNSLAVVCIAIMCIVIVCTAIMYIAISYIAIFMHIAIRYVATVYVACSYNIPVSYTHLTLPTTPYV